MVAVAVDRYDDQILSEDVHLGRPLLDVGVAVSLVRLGQLQVAEGGEEVRRGSERSAALRASSSFM